MKDRAILIVDDLVENLQVIVSIFEQNRPDLVIYQANSGEMGLELALLRKRVCGQTTLPLH